jgi:hypothetical protein
VSAAPCPSCSSSSLPAGLLTRFTVEHREDKVVKSVRAFQQAQQRKITQGEEKLQVGLRSCHISPQPLPVQLVQVTGEAHS